MTTNHPAHGPVSLDRLHQIREHLQHDTQYSNGGNRAYILADVLKVIDVAITSFGAEPVAWTDEEELRDAKVAGIGYLFGIDKDANKFADPRRQIMLYRHALPVPAVPDGYVIVPIAPTEDMIINGFESVPDPQSGELGQEFYTAVNLESAMEQGAVPDGDTILWWLKQSPEARSAICVDDALPISSALSELSHFINRHSDNPKYLKVWGNGATFDNVILRGAYDRAGQVCPWQFWNDHDVRTIVTLGRVVGFDPKRDMPFDGVAHNALSDARHQAKYVSAIWKKLIPATSSDL